MIPLFKTKLDVPCLIHKWKLTRVQIEITATHAIVYITCTHILKKYFTKKFSCKFI